MLALEATAGRRRRGDLPGARLADFARGGGRCEGDAGAGAARGGRPAAELDLVRPRRGWRLTPRTRIINWSAPPANPTGWTARHRDWG